MKYYNSTNTCDRCREKGIIEKLVPHTNAYREKDKEGNWTGNWICHKCHMHDYDKKRDRKKESRERYLRDRRIGNLDPNSEQAKGDRFQKLTCRWRSTISTVPVEDLNIKLDNYNAPIDHSVDSELGIIQTKGATYNSYNQYWTQIFISEHNQIAKGFKFDILILYCASKDGKYIERIYIFPVEEILRRTSIGIAKNPSKGGWYEKYRVKDKETIKKVNNIWKEIIK